MTVKSVLKFLCWSIFVLLVVVPLVGGGVYFLVGGKDLWKSGAQIGVVWVRGVLSDPREYVEGLRSFRENGKVKAVILRVDSPGGGVSAAQEIFREVGKTRAVKPVVASLGGMATSGGYYIASPCSKIVASPGTITGSIGVIAVFPNFEKLFEKIGYTMVVIKSGEFKDIGSPSRPMTPEEETLMRDTILEVHDQFVRDVAQARELEEEKVRHIADGRILTGAKAKHLGLIDELGNFNDAVELARTLAQIEEKPSIIYHEKKKKLLDFLIGEESMDGLREILSRVVQPFQWRFP